MRASTSPYSRRLEMGDSEPEMDESAIPKLAPICLGVVQKLYPDTRRPTLGALAPIWDEVVQRIIDEMTALDLANEVALHINIREEMVMELVRLQFWLAERVVEKRIGERTLSEIDAEREREECLGPDGATTISATAQMAYEHVWSKRMKERWQPKSAKALDKEANPKPATLAVKAVEKNHFIPRWFIRDNWTTNDRIRRWRQTEDGWTSTWAGLGEWGYRHKLYSDPLEAYFGLLEGDAKRPIQMLLETNPLNIPQREALIGFLIIQVLCNPHIMAAVERALAPIIADLGCGDDPEMPRKAYETLFRNNEFYHTVSHPVMWSPWAIVRSERPVFVLPDTFSARTGTPDGMRLIAPLTPTACFVTLPGTEKQKRIVPYGIKADDDLARRISIVLTQAAVEEFLSAPDLVPFDGEGGSLGELLEDLAKLAREQDRDHAQSGSST